ncbi:MAG: S1C family serine protease [Lachnospiraceae bacterium]|nr:S1C family serine protease [Lachnospiraceae bacterium]MEE3460684.1 S1C family serine protease [Lachnospiraceae bacterium]
MNENMNNEERTNAFNGAEQNAQNENAGQNVNAENSQQVNAARGSDAVNIRQTADTDDDHNTSDKGQAITGEYGNQIPDSSVTYSYSYKNDPDSASHSGDYNARNDSNYSNGSYNGNSNNYNSANYNSANNTSGYNNNNGGNYNNGNYGSSFNNNQGGPQNYNNGSFMHYGNNAPEPPKKKDKKSHPFLINIGKSAVYALVFGLIAGVIFEGVLFAGGKLTGSRIESTNNGSQIGTTQTANSNATSVVTGAAASTQTNVTKIVENTMPSIVAIACTSEGQDYYSIFGGYYKGEDVQSAGTGFIVGKNSKELLIATNNHVVDGSKTISVQFFDGKVVKAEIKGNDSSNDVAVVAVKLSDIESSTMSKIKIASLGDSNKIEIGQQAIAIGNALGYGQSVTVGYISAKDREMTEESEDGKSTGAKIKVIQTDAAINPGNSGGPLLDMNGNVIGITSAKIADQTVEGIGYAIPISDASPILTDLMNREKLSDSEKGYLGITGISVSNLNSSMDMPEGVYVNDVAKGGAADKAGIYKGDIITELNGTAVTTIENLQERVNNTKKGTEVKIKLKRLENGEYKEHEVTAKLQGKSSLSSLPDTSSKDDQANGQTQDPGNGNDQENGQSNGNDQENGQSNGNESNPFGGSEGNDQGNGSEGGNSFGDIFPYMFGGQ